MESTMLTRVREFMSLLGQPTPSHPDLHSFRRGLRASLILEEAVETVNALGFGISISEGGAITMEAQSEANWQEVIDGLVDLLYVTLGAFVEAGLDPEPFFAEVHRTNLEKRGGETREDGKLLKPEGWQKPDILLLLARQLMEGRDEH